jgi:hypothetical protein
VAYSSSSLRGALLEEAVLHLLRRSGYVPVLRAGADPTLNNGRAGLEVRGRGSWHQIDAVSDFFVTPPFANPQRLLVEAKFHSEKIGLPFVRNATGVLKDVSESWVVDPGSGNIPKKQFHYLYAIFSASDFSSSAQDYAYAQDIYLLPLRRSAFLRPVIEAIDHVTVDRMRTKPPLYRVRRHLRSRLLDERSEEQIDDTYPDLANSIDAVVEACKALRFACITMFGRQFAAFLVASREFDPAQIIERMIVRIRWLDGGWFIENQGGQKIFSFDLPEEIVERYTRRGELGVDVVAEIKNELMREFYAFYDSGQSQRLLHFLLDEAWFEPILRRHQR